MKGKLLPVSSPVVTTTQERKNTIVATLIAVRDVVHLVVVTLDTLVSSRVLGEDSNPFVDLHCRKWWDGDKDGEEISQCHYPQSVETSPKEGGDVGQRSYR